MLRIGIPVIVSLAIIASFDFDLCIHSAALSPVQIDLFVELQPLLKRIIWIRNWPYRRTSPGKFNRIYLTWQRVDSGLNIQVLTEDLINGLLHQIFRDIVPGSGTEVRHQLVTDLRLDVLKIEKASEPLPQHFIIARFFKR
ncbi:hypothetical protein AMR74_15125 [Halorubrum tropicale]|uniref:Uncharacterized protein n=1 Tax=Halorubrum tropicale TaxID=1765655 RepID=A0A0N1IUV6_9EURY|nr:hypothetical protein AMR74_15125 [Halorubrum tropicale]